MSRAMPPARLGCAPVVAIALLASLAGPGRACAPSFPNQVLLQGDRGLKAMPTADFEAELDRLRLAGMPVPRQVWGSGAAESARVDVTELDAALAAAGGPPAERRRVVAAYAAVRNAVTDHQDAIADARERGDPKIPPLPATALPDGMPGEFADYAAGLVAYHRDRDADARAAWLKLLARPAGQRRRRSVWAAYMVGRSLVRSADPTEAVDWFERTRTLAAAGFDDPLALSAESLGWQAKVDLDAGRYPAATDLYLRQRWAGDPTAATSLAECAQAVLKANGAAMAAAAGDRSCRRVVTAFLVSHGGEPAVAGRWLAAVESAAATDVAGADRLAWAAYSAGDFAAAKRWAARAPVAAPIGRWVRAELALRAGRVDDAAALLASVVTELPATPVSIALPGLTAEERFGTDDGGDLRATAAGDLAVLRLARSRYADALDLLLVGPDHWPDAAYVAERVLTTDELRAYIDHRLPAGNPAAGRVRHLLARRLARAGRFADARAYLPAEHRPDLDAYAAAVRDGADVKRSNVDRARSLMAAARLARWQGLELLGTELDPDYACYGGNFEVGGADERLTVDGPISRPTPGEVARVAASDVKQPRRWHYRYLAADQAWAATRLLPDGNAETAHDLWEAGNWLKARDPQAADRFYKALVRRCPGTELGKRAAALHWLPKALRAAVDRSA